MSTSGPSRHFAVPREKKALRLLGVDIVAFGADRTSNGGHDWLNASRMTRSGHSLFAPHCKFFENDVLGCDPRHGAVGMRRRDFLAAVSGAMSWPAAANAQQAGRLPTIGFLGSDPVAFAPWIAAFVARLRELGWIDGRTVAIEYQWSEGRKERYAEIAAEFVRQKVDVIVTVGSAVPTVRQATSGIPIVFAVAIDPERSGLVSSLAKPGGNVTGLSLQAANLAGKRLEILRELIPRLRRLAIIFNGGNDQTVLEMSDTEAAARELNLDVALLEIL
jgi:putative tryptophan/tyrosine transport system substrate-binding protein